MRNRESIRSSKIDRLKMGLRAGALTVGLLLPTAASAAADKNHRPARHPESLGMLITAAEHKVSNRIGEKVPVNFKNCIAHYRGFGEEFYIDNPLVVTVKKDGGGKVKLIGYIEQKGGPTGPDVALFEYNKHTTLLPNPNDPAIGEPISQVIFPAADGVGSPFDTTNPVDPLTGSQYLDPYGERALVGYQYTDSTK